MKIYIVIYSRCGSSDLSIMGIYADPEKADKRLKKLAETGDYDMEAPELTVACSVLDEDKEIYVW